MNDFELLMIKIIENFKFENNFEFNNNRVDD